MKIFRVWLWFSSEYLNFDYSTYENAQRNMNRIVKKLKLGKMFHLAYVDDFEDGKDSSGFWINPKTFTYLYIEEREREK